MLCKQVIFALALLVSVTAKPKWHDLENYTFEKFVEDFRFNFPANEIETRRKLFETELHRVNAHNKKNLSWKEGINHFSAMTLSEKKGTHGRSKGAASHAKKQGLKSQRSINDVDFKVLSIEEMPKEVDWREKGIISPVKDQGHCGSCWAFASTATIESYVAKESGLLFSLSPEQIAMCAPNPESCGGFGGCEGSIPELAFDYLSTSQGLYEEFQYSYLSYDGKDYDCNTDSIAKFTSPKGMINGYVKLPENSYLHVMTALAAVGPLAINVDASTWHAYEEGIFNGCNQDSPDVNHVVQLVGYGEENGEKYWLVRNSWSASFGEAGYIRLARQDTEESVCGEDTTPQDGTGCEQDKDTPVRVCGTCGTIYDTSYVLSASALG